MFFIKLLESKSTFQRGIREDKCLNETIEGTSLHPTLKSLHETVNELDFSNFKSLSSKRSSHCVSKDSRYVRSNLTLVAVCSLFLIAEFPQSILLLFSMLSSNFYQSVYKPLGDLLDILVLINYSASFSLYCSMSKEFRNSFCTTFKIRKNRNI